VWRRFEGVHGGLGPQVEELLTTDPLDRRALPALRRLLSVYGRRLTTRSYLDSLGWMPEGLKEILAIHTLNAGVAPYRTPALYASMPAIMARQGVFTPEGGVYEIPATLERLARSLGAGIHTGEPVENIRPGRVSTGSGEYAAEAVVSDVDEFRLKQLLGEKLRTPHRLSCSGVAVYAALKEPLPLPGHSVILPTEPQRLYESVEARAEPPETMSFVNYYPPGEVSPNDRPVLALLLTAPANGNAYGLDDAFVEREMERVSETLGLSCPITAEFEENTVLDPAYFARGGAPGGALYGVAHPFWKRGPLHRPRYSDGSRPWLWRVGASVHPGGGIPAVLGGAMISTDRLLKRLR
jgi:phytoene dehydrogenase-like protein